MGGIIGATSGKFALVVATLLLHGRVNNDRAEIAITPGNAVSAVSEARADMLSHGKPLPASIKIGLRAEYFYADMLAVEKSAAVGADLRIGRDLLDRHPIEIDFARQSLRLLLPGEARHTEAHMVILLVTRVDGALTVPVKIADGSIFFAPLDLSQSGDARVRFRDGALRVAGDGGTISHAPSLLGMSAFQGARVIFDLGNNRIFMAQ